VGHLKLTPTEALAILDETQRFRIEMKKIINAWREHQWKVTSKQDRLPDGT